MGKPTTKLNMSALMQAMTEDESAQRGLAISPDGRMHISGFTLTPTGIAEIDPNVSQEQFEQFGTVLRNVHKAMQFLLGDFVNHAMLRYGDDRREQLAEWFGVELKTLYEYCHVAKAVEFSIRMENLSFGHHQLVAPMAADDQLRWLKQADENHWSVAALRRAIKKAAHIEDDDDKPVLTPAMKQAKIDHSFIETETQWPGWEQNDHICQEVKTRIGRLTAYYDDLLKRLG